MKTHVMLLSSDRELFGVTIRQNTKEQFLSVSDLQAAYERARWQHGWSDRKVADVLQTKEVKERLFYVLESQGFIKTNIVGFMKMIEEEGIAKVLKGLGVYKTTGRGSDKTVMCNPYVWFLLAMELNPMIYAKVVVWLTDTLVFDRIDAGSEFVPMNSAIKAIIANPDYPLYCRLINTKIFGKHITGMRNIASAPELRKIANMERFVTSAIDAGFVDSEAKLFQLIEKYEVR